MQTETAVAAVASTPVINNQPNTTISVSRGVDMAEDDKQNVLIVTTLPVQKMDVIIDKTSIVLAKTALENIATNSYACGVSN